ncbi:MAG: pyruvate kinase [Clostridia bacterium]|nr:pyruvate kinase [Clostridia bacterium]MBO5206676.1 pyruvate kinase [Clostridia bacterium]MBP3582447.1 pyruvate kinase [Clostridia bacterium]
MRKTKIICTIGPASDSEDTLIRMCRAGMNVARLNFSHGTHDEHREKFALIKRVREKLGLPIAVMLDTKGPEYRIGTFKDKKITLSDGDSFIFTTEDVVGDESRVSVSYKNLVEELTVGDRILLNNGLIIFEVRELRASEAVCEVISGGVLSDRKSMNFPNKTLGGEFLSEADKADLLLGIEEGCDFVAASFVSCEADIRSIREFLDANGGEDIDVIAKIENRAGVDNIDDICKVADGIMVARGDLGVEIPFVEVPAIQKYLIKKCRLLGKRVITATEMLESMIHNPRPTRAEISDVANAVYDGSSAVMLSGETAAGEHPAEAVRFMSDICEFTERGIDYGEWFRTTEFRIRNNADAVSHATCAMAIDVNAKSIVVNSLSGKTARMVSRFRCPVDIIGITTDERAWRKLNLSWGVTPIMSEEYESMEVMFYNALRKAKEALRLCKGDNVVITGGQIGGKAGSTNTIKLECIK